MEPLRRSLSSTSLIRTLDALPSIGAAMGCGDLIDSKVRALHFFIDQEGSRVIHGRLPAEPGTVFVKAVDAVVRQQDNEAAAARTREMMPVVIWTCQRKPRASAGPPHLSVVTASRTSCTSMRQYSTSRDTARGRKPLQRRSTRSGGGAGDPVRAASNRIQTSEDRPAA